MKAFCWHLLRLACPLPRIEIAKEAAHDLIAVDVEYSVVPRRHCGVYLTMICCPGGGALDPESRSCAYCLIFPPTQITPLSPDILYTHDPTKHGTWK